MIIIAESGLSWNNFNEAIQMCDAAKECNADIVKFQIVENPILPQLTFGEWKVIKRYCEDIGIEFLATPSSQRIIDFLENIGCDKIKIGSDHINDDWGIKEETTIIVSNGYYNINKIDFDNLNVIKMYCVSLYPCDENYIKWQDMTGFDGFSDHTKNISVEWCNKIKSKNFEYYEKHFTLGFNKIDECVSITKDQLFMLTARLALPLKNISVEWSKNNNSKLSTARLILPPIDKVLK